MKPIPLLPNVAYLAIPALFCVISIFWLIVGLGLFSILPGSFGLLFYLFTRFPRIKASQEGFILQRNAKEEPFVLPWSQVKCVYTLTRGFTYKACGLLFTPHPLSKQEQFLAAKLCQHGLLNPTLLHEGCLWVGIVGLPPELRSLLPEDIRVMPPSACDNTNSLFTKLI